MSGDAASCPSCGAQNLAGAKFCGACGQTLGASAPGAPQAAPAPLSPAPAASPAKVSPKRTMMGMMPIAPPPGEAGTAATPGPTPSPAPSPQTTPASSPGRARTMMGMSPIAPPSGPGAAPVGASPGAPILAPEGADPHEQPTVQAVVPAMAANTQRTMLGMPQVDIDAARAAAREAVEEAATAPATESPGQPPAPRGDPLGPTNRTMLGMTATPRPGAGSDSGYPGPPAAAPAGPPRRRAHRQYADASSIPPPPPRRSSRGLVIAGVGLVLLMLVVGGGLGIYLLVAGGSSSVRASVVPSEAGDGLRVEVEDAPAGARARFGGQELPLEDGVSVFPLASDTLVVGDNELTVEVVDGDGGQEAHTVILTVSYRVRADLSALAAETPALAIVVDALPGSEVTVGEEPLTLDAEGRGRRLYPIEGTAGDAVLEHQADYRVALPDGQVHVGSVETRVPFATLQLDRPGVGVVTEAEGIEIAGAVHPSATVTIGGVAIEHTEGRFIHTYALGDLGDHEVQVLARQPGRAPRSLTLRVRRVADMEAEAAAFVAEPGLDYARLAQNPTIYRGKQVILEGRVYNVDVSNGRSFLQILVRGCPRGQRCPLWVTYSQATDATVHDWIRVLGTVTGEQQFRSESDRVITVPRVDAQFVLPARAQR